MTASMAKMMRKQELDMIKRSTSSLRDDSNEVERRKPVERREQTNRYGAMGSICDATYNVLRTYHF